MLTTETNIVQSAISAFNNAALVAPAFLWSAILALPIFIIVWKYGNTLLDLFGWTKQNIVSKTCKWTVSLTLLWVILFGGNYSVLRDTHTMLPFVTAAILFLSGLFIGTHRQNFQIPQILKKDTFSKIFTIIFAFTIIALIDIHTWWGPILQISSAFIGLAIGNMQKIKTSDITITLILILTTIIAILMQPEFFRFGQLGNLGPLHLTCILAFGLCTSATFALLQVKPTNKFREPVYIKLKWLARVFTILGISTFLLTESVPMLVLTLLVSFTTCFLSIKHSKVVSTDLGSIMFGLSVFLFGILTTIPVISCLGLLQISSVKSSWREFKFLL